VATRQRNQEAAQPAGLHILARGPYNRRATQSQVVLTSRPLLLGATEGDNARPRRYSGPVSPTDTPASRNERLLRREARPEHVHVGAAKITGTTIR
jgi:hypothetical protein